MYIIPVRDDHISMAFGAKCLEETGGVRSGVEPSCSASRRIE
jgi:hypothetical protein